MEPKLPTPNHGLELPNISYGQNAEQLPSSNLEVDAQLNAEKLEQRSEAPLVDNSVLAPVLPAPIVIPQPSVPLVNDTLAPGAVPLVANDDDLIEKEWVEKAKDIIVQTKDDPYRREQEVGRLQVDYQRKRYGRELGDPQ